MKISLIITVFNCQKYIEGAINSFLSQDYGDKELLIFDKNSTDKSHEIIAKYQAKYPEIIKWIKEDDKGISQARNKAIKHATGDLIGFLGGDDLLNRGFYTKINDYVAVNNEFDALYFNSYTIGQKSSFDASTQIPITKKNLIKHCPIASGESFYYKKSIFEKFEFNENNFYSMDYELNMAIVCAKKDGNRKYNFAPVNIVGVFNRACDESISFSSPLFQRLETVAVQLKYAKNNIEKFKIIWRKKKMILRNLAKFIEIKNKL